MMLSKSDVLLKVYLHYAGTGQIFGICCQYLSNASLILRLAVAVCLRFHIPFLLPLWDADIFRFVSSVTLRVTRFAIMFVFRYLMDYIDIC